MNGETFKIPNVMFLNVACGNNRKGEKDSHREIYTRRRLVDLAKSQAQDIAILREELERLRLKTYPAFQV